MRGVDTLLLVSPAVPAQEIAVIDSAVRNGVTHVVKVTSKASADSPVGRRRGQAQIEAHLRAAGPAGPELITYDDVARELTETLGHHVEYRRISPEKHREAMLQAGLPEPVATSNAQAFDQIAHGDAAWLSGDFATLTGRAPRSLHTFVADHIGAFA